MKDKKNISQIAEQIVNFEKRVKQENRKPTEKEIEQIEQSIANLSLQEILELDTQIIKVLN